MHSFQPLKVVYWKMCSSQTLYFSATLPQRCSCDMALKDIKVRMDKERWIYSWRKEIWLSETVMKRKVRKWMKKKCRARERAREQERERAMLCCAIDPSPLITGGCPEKSLPAGGICASAKWTWNMPRWITEGPSAPLAVPLHDNPRETEGRGEKREVVGV